MAETNSIKQELLLLLVQEYMQYVKVVCIDAEKQTFQVAFLPGTPEAILQLYGVHKPLPNKLN